MTFTQALTDNVNLMAMNLTDQVRSIAEVTKAVANGDLTKKVEIDVKGEFLELKETVNQMTESLSVFADEVTRVAREVGTEGRLGGQAKVKNVAGTWKALTDNVNVMASNVRHWRHLVSFAVRLTFLTRIVDTASARDRVCDGECMLSYYLGLWLITAVDGCGTWRLDAEDHECAGLWRDVGIG